MVSKKLTIGQLKEIRKKETRALLGSMPKSKKLTQREQIIQDIKRIRKARLQKTLKRVKVASKIAGKIGIKAFDFLDDITTKPEKRAKLRAARMKRRKM